MTDERRPAFIKDGKSYFEGDRVHVKRKSTYHIYDDEEGDGVITFFPERGEYRLVPVLGSGNLALSHYRSLYEYDSMQRVADRAEKKAKKEER